MREMRGAGIVTVELVPTAINPAEIFTKILSRQVFEKHRETGPLICRIYSPGRMRPGRTHPPNAWLAAGGVAWHS